MGLTQRSTTSSKPWRPTSCHDSDEEYDGNSTADPNDPPYSLLSSSSSNSAADDTISPQGKTRVSQSMRSRLDAYKKLAFKKIPRVFAENSEQQNAIALMAISVLLLWIYVLDGFNFAKFVRMILLQASGKTLEIVNKQWDEPASPWHDVRSAWHKPPLPVGMHLVDAKYRQIALSQVVDFYSPHDSNQVLESVQFRLDLEPAKMIWTEEMQEQGIFPQLVGDATYRQVHGNVTVFERPLHKRPKLLGIRHCPQPDRNVRLWIRIIGDAILAVPLAYFPAHTLGERRGGEWQGSFDMPPHMDGNYTVEILWFAALCGNDGKALPNNKAVPTRVQVENALEFSVVNSHSNASILHHKNQPPVVPDVTWAWSESMYTPHAVWVPARWSRYFGHGLLPREEPQQFQWRNPALATDLDLGKTVTADPGKGVLPLPSTSVVAMDGTVYHDHDGLVSTYYESFAQLSNYELVCWFGGKTAQALYSAFLSLRPFLFDEQRPFKFQYYPVFSYRKPDATWDHELKTKFRKCKHILVVLDDDVFMEREQYSDKNRPATTHLQQQQYKKNRPLSAPEFQSAVKTLVQHLVIAFPDSSFPIWVFTIALESPRTAFLETKHCHTTVRTTLMPKGELPQHHPCNTALFDLFQTKQKWLKNPRDHDRVRLLDNTPVSMAAAVMHTTNWLAKAPTLEEDYNKHPDNSQDAGFLQHPRRDDILGVIALRIYVLIGKQVQEWRHHLQKGTANGLHRNGTVIPNVEQVPYSWRWTTK